MRKIALLATLAALPGLAACGGDDQVVVETRTVHTSAGGLTTPTAPTTPTTPVFTQSTPTTGGVTTSTDEGAPLEQRMPPSGTVPNMKAGEVRHVPTAAAMVGQLYSAGDSAIPAATQRLREKGYEDGYLRDQKGEDITQTTLVRMYSMRLRDGDAAQAEVNESIDEVVASSTAKFTPVDTEGPYARAIRATLPNGMSVLFVAWASGRDVYGIQVFGKDLHQAEVMKAVSQNHLAWS